MKRTEQDISDKELDMYQTAEQLMAIVGTLAPAGLLMVPAMLFPGTTIGAIAAGAAFLFSYPMMPIGGMAIADALTQPMTRKKAATTNLARICLCGIVPFHTAGRKNGVKQGLYKPDRL